MKKSIVLFSAFFITVWALAQQADAPSTKPSANCTQVLRLACAVYEQGRLHELENLLDGCLKSEVGPKGFATVQEKVDAYRLLCLSYIYLEEPAKADQAMLDLLNTDHFFAVNPTDPAEFQALYATFRTNPIISFGGKVGGTMTIPSILKHYYVDSKAVGQGKYKPGISFIGGFFAEKELFPKSKYKLLSNSVVLGEVFYHLRPFKKVVKKKFENDVDGDKSADFSGKSISGWLDFNLILRYRIKPKSVYDPYIGLGPGLSYLLSSKYDLSKTPTYNLDGNISGTVTGAAIDTKPAFYKVAQTVTALGGVKFRFGEIYINAEARYQFGINNLVNAKNRTIEKLVNDYHETFDDYRQSNIILNVGVTYPYFKPKKRKK